MIGENEIKNKVRIPLWIWERSLSYRFNSRATHFFISLSHALYGLQQPYPPRAFYLDFEKLRELMGVKRNYLEKWFKNKKHPDWKILLELYPELLTGNGTLIIPNFGLFELEAQLRIIWERADNLMHEMILGSGREEECPLCKEIIKIKYQID